MKEILKVKHHPSICSSKGMFGSDCKNCDINATKNVHTAIRNSRRKEVK